MQVVNDDMDDLYRKAAEDYPLNTDSADWDSVLKKLSAERSLNAGTSSKNKSYRHLLWLLLLLPMGLIYKNYFFQGSEKPADTVLKNPANKNSAARSITEKGSSLPNTTQKAGAKTKDPFVISKGSSVIHRKEKGELNTFIGENTSTAFIADNSSNNTIPAQKLEAKQKEAVTIVQNKDITGDKNETQIIPEIKKEESVVNEKNETLKSAAKTKRKQKESGLYAGIMASPDISTVKFQSVKNIGVNMGIVAGYRLNKKLSIESGIFWSIKNYYSDGAYFKTNNIWMPAGAKISKVEGVCNMIEVPLTIKYNFSSAGKKTLSVSGGVSSYFMKKESYDYDIDKNGQQYPYSSTYKNRSSHLLAVANFAVGYNRQIKKGTDLRIEPYIKIPLKGVGTGSLPILSTGVNIGITKKIFR